MTPSSHTPVSGVTLATLGVRGRDAASFLHGQLSNDVQSLAPGAQQLAGYHNPQGRVIALLRLARLGPGELLAQLPAELADAVAQRLRRYVLRAQVTIEVLDAATAAAHAASVAGWNATRSRGADIAAGVPQVYAATSEKFVAQMLNLDCVGAVSFDKGCYTGQEVIARAHFRGRVKRRMQRFATLAPLAAAAGTAAAAAAASAALAPGGSLRLADGRRFETVDAVALADGRIEFLAVGPLPGRREDAAAESAAVPASTAAPSASDLADATAGLPLIDCTPLPLPYALPD